MNRVLEWLVSIWSPGPWRRPRPDMARLKVVVRYLSDTWPTVLHRRTYAQGMARREELRDGLNQTHAAHVQNALQDVLLIDLIREIGALVLDTDRRTASVANAIRLLRDSNVLKELEVEYRVIPPVPTRMINEDDLDPETAAQVRKSIYNDELRRNLKRLAALPATIKEMKKELLSSKVGRTIRTARNKAVAHYEVIRDGSDWKMWRIDGAGLTYGQLDAYVDEATSAIDKLSHFVLHSAFDFEGSRRIGEERVAQYVDALVAGLQIQRSEWDAIRARMQSELEELEARAARQLRGE
jgi:hypothetical protein